MGEMNFEMFKKFVAEKIIRFLPDVYATCRVSVEQVVKNNGRTADAIMIDGPGKIHPVVYLSEFYGEYKGGKAIEDVMEEIAEMVTHAKRPDINISNIMEYGRIKDAIQPRLVNYERNEGFLQDKPYRMVMGDLAVLYKIQLEVSEGEVASITIDDRLIDRYGVNEEDLYQAAIANMDKGQVTFCSMQEMLQEMFTSSVMESLDIDKDVAEAFVREQTDETVDKQMFILSNSDKIYGAAEILSPAVQKMIADRIGDCYILPSSVHEVIILPKTDQISYEELQEMVEDVNVRSVATEEQLSDSVYEYDAKNMELTKCGMEEREKTEDYRVSRKR